MKIIPQSGHIIRFSDSHLITSMPIETLKSLLLPNAIMTLPLQILVALGCLMILRSFRRYILFGVVDHVSFLSVGAFYYLITPFLAYSYDWYSGGPAYALWYSSFSGVYANTLFYVCFYLVSVGFPFWLGSLRWRAQILDLRPLLASRKPLLIFFVGLLLFDIVSISKVIPLVGTGYTIDYAYQDYGAVAGCLLFFLLIHLFLSDGSLLFRSSNGIWISRLSFFLVFVNSVLLLSLGVRTYPIFAFTSIVASRLAPFGSCQTTLTSRIKVKYLSRLAYLLSLPLLVLLAVYVGVSRMGSSFDLELIRPYFLAESLLGSITISDATEECLGQLRFLFSYPSEVVSAFVGVIPRILLPGKDILLQADRECVFAPLGGYNITSGLLVGFGVIGAFLAVLSFSLILALLRRSARRGGSWLYSYACGGCISMIFRDPLSVSVRVMLLYPAIFIAMIFIIPRISAPRRF